MRLTIPILSLSLFLLIVFTPNYSFALPNRTIESAEKAVKSKKKKPSLFQRLVTNRAKKKLKKHFPKLFDKKKGSIDCDILIKKDGSEVLAKVA